MLKCLSYLGVGLNRLLAGTDRRFDGMLGNRLEQLAGYRAVDANTPDADAQAGPILVVVPAALVAVGVTSTRAIMDPLRVSRLSEGISWDSDQIR